MTLFVNVKQLGKKKDAVHSQPLEIESIPSTAGELIAQVVRIQLARFNEKPDEESFLPYLIQTEINDQEETGKVGFDVNYNQQKADPEKAVKNALQAFEDGIFRLFLNETELENATTAIQLSEGDQLTFIRLTMLAGRIW